MDRKRPRSLGVRYRLERLGVELAPVKLLSLCMAHARTQMTEHYIAEAALTAQVQEAALQVAYGHERPSSK